MAIKRKKEEKTLQIPEVLDDMLLAGFTSSCLEKHYKEMGSGARKGIKEYLETNTDGFEISLSESWKCDYGSVNLKIRKSYDIDTDGIIEKVNEGKVTIETLLAVAKFSAADLAKLGLGDLCTEKPDPTEFIELRANAEFKEKVESRFNKVEVARFDEIIESKPVKKEVKKIAKKAPKESPEEKIAKAMAKVKSKKSPESDLEQILGGE